MRSSWRGRSWSLSDTLVRDYDVVEFLSRLCQRSVEVLEVTAAGALLTDGAKQLQVVAASTETVTVAADPASGGPVRGCLPRGRRAGPCPTFAGWADAGRCSAPRALGAGMAGVCAFPMRLRADRIGALNVFQATPGALDEAAAGQALADVATIAILQARVVEDAARLAGQLERALESGWWSSRPRGSWPSGSGSTRRWRSSDCGEPPPTRSPGDSASAASETVRPNGPTDPPTRLSARPLRLAP